MTDASLSLKSRLDNGEFIAAPGIFELISAKIANSMDFQALYMTGYGAVASSMGLPDAGLATYTDMVNSVQTICGAIDKPLIADGDTGYGGLLNVDHTVRGYEKAGAAGIQMEDQQSPKKCGHMPGRQVIDLEDMVLKIKVAAEARDSEDFIIVARTDARTNYGLDEAIKRGQAFQDAGADVVFVESPESVDEMEKICKAIEKPKLVNVVDGGSTPVLSNDELQQIGYNMAIFPATGFLAAAAALKSAYKHIEKTGSSAGLNTPLYNFHDFSELMGFDKVWEFESRWLEK